jgi:hypothetical protein
MSFTPQEQDWIDEAAQANRFAVLAPLSPKLKRNGGEWEGPCPVCGGTNRFSINDKKNVFNCRGCNPKNNIIKFVQYVNGCGFFEAVEYITGRPHPKGYTELPAAKAKREAEQAARKEKYKQEQDQRDKQEAQRVKQATERFIALYKAAAPIYGTLAQTYLAKRGIAALPTTTALRFAAALDYWHNGQKLHTGPALLAPFVNHKGVITGGHQTWIDLSQPKGKLSLIHEGNPLPAKKMVGEVMGSHLPLVGEEYPFKKFESCTTQRLYLGEGIETTLAVWLALGEDALYWAAGSLGNMSGIAQNSVPNPVQEGRYVQGDVPNFARPALALPASITHLIILQDGDSDPLMTDLAMKRAAHRYAAECRHIQVFRAPKGKDFADILQEAA